MTDTTSLRRLIWLYLALWFFEGSLRKWVFPGLSDPLLLIREPVVFACYFLALRKGLFPMNGWVITAVLMAGAAVIASIIAGQMNLFLTAYGVRINYLHLPMIWIIGTVFNREDVERVGSAALILAIPLAFLMKLQFDSGPDSWVNRGVGGSEGAQLAGEAGRIRPAGFFTFITGPQLFLPLAVAFLVYQGATRRRLPRLLLLVSAVAVLLAIPISISRAAFVMSVLVVAVFFAAQIISGRLAPRLLQAGVIAVLMWIVTPMVPVFRPAVEVFQMRWENAAQVEGEGDAFDGMKERLLSDLTEPVAALGQAPLFGVGIGYGSSLGARFAGGGPFTLSENEWTRTIWELGPVLGAAFILFRITLAGWLLLIGWRTLRRNGNLLPIVLFAAVAHTLMLGQLGPPTLHGFMIGCCGLILAAARDPIEEEFERPLEAEPA